MNKSQVMRANRLRGNSYERRLQTDLRKVTDLCQRSAGSHSPVDIWCIKGENLFLIQAKSGVARPEKERELLIKYADQIGEIIPIDAHTENHKRSFLDLRNGFDWKDYLFRREI